MESEWSGPTQVGRTKATPKLRTYNPEKVYMRDLRFLFAGAFFMALALSDTDTEMVKALVSLLPLYILCELVCYLRKNVSITWKDGTAETAEECR